VAAEQRAAQVRALPLSATRTSKISRDTQQVGASLYRFGSLPFEIASVLLLVAIVGSVMLARTAKQERAADDLDPDRLDELARTEADLISEGGNRSPAGAESEAVVKSHV